MKWQKKPEAITVRPYLRMEKDIRLMRERIEKVLQIIRIHMEPRRPRKDPVTGQHNGQNGDQVRIPNASCKFMDSLPYDGKDGPGIQSGKAATDPLRRFIKSTC